MPVFESCNCRVASSGRAACSNAQAGASAAFVEAVASLRAALQGDGDGDAPATKNKEQDLEVSALFRQRLELLVLDTVC